MAEAEVELEYTINLVRPKGAASLVCTAISAYKPPMNNEEHP